MARLARRCDVCPGQREFRRTVVEGCRLPGSRGMTRLAILTEVARDVIWIRRAIEIRAVALVAIRIHQLVIPVRMARLARGRKVRPCQREFCGAMVEGRGLPRRRGMARLAVLAEVAGNVVRIRRAGEIRAVTLIAIRKHQRIVVVDVARLALDRGMRARQREFRSTVVERGAGPRGCGMTLCTVR